MNIQFTFAILCLAELPSTTKPHPMNSNAYDSFTTTQICFWPVIHQAASLKPMRLRKPDIAFLRVEGSRAPKTDTLQSTLFQAQHGERLDTIAAGAASGADPHLAAVENINQPVNGNGQPSGDAMRRYIRCAATGLLLALSIDTSAQVTNPPATPSGTGAASPTVINAARDVISLKDFGAVCDGSTDDTTRIQAALDSGAKRIDAQAGTCKVGTLSVPSNVELRGAGWATVFLLKNGVNGPVIQVRDGVSGVTLRDFKISANSANQNVTGSSDGVLVHQKASDVRIEGVWVDDVADWGFAIMGSKVILHHAKATNITGAKGANAVRAGYLVGSSVPALSASMVTIDDSEVSNCAVPYTDGFILEHGTDVVVTNSRALNCYYSGFKVKTDRTLIQGNLATGNLVGFQVQGPAKYVTFNGNSASRNRGPGFQFNQTSSSDSGRSWNIIGNNSLDNGQDSSAGTGYGFNFDNGVDAHVYRVNIVGNQAMDTSGQSHQSRGFSFGKNGSYHQVSLIGNKASGAKLDWYAIASLDMPTFTQSENSFTKGGPLPHDIRDGTLNISTLKWNGASAASLGISVNMAGDGERTYFIFLSSQVSSANNTISAGYMVRCGYDGNNFTATKISGDQSARPSSTYTFSQINGTLYVQAPENGSHMARVYANQ